MKPKKKGESMENTFDVVLEAFNSLKTKFQAGEISGQEFVEEMKKLRIKDDEGRTWMIGAKTGMWYFFDGKDWIQAEPPSPKEKKAICPYCGFENKPETVVCVRCGGNIGETRQVCPKCGAALEKPYLNCPACSTGPVEKEIEEEKEETKPIPQRDDWDREKKKIAYVLRSVQPSSFFLFGGALGLLIGVLAGTFAGATAYFSKALTFLPQSLANLQGKLLGAIIYGLGGGIVGFLVIGYLAFLKAVLVNLILSLTGGIKFKLQRAPVKATKEGSDEESD